jgi:hypothetical protein
MKNKIVPSIVTLFFYGAIASDGLGSPYVRGFMITLRHTTLGGTPKDE